METLLVQCLQEKPCNQWKCLFLVLLAQPHMLADRIYKSQTVHFLAPKVMQYGKTTCYSALLSAVVVSSEVFQILFLGD